MNQPMADILLDAWANPAQRQLFYSTDNAVTGSETLNDTPFWDWTPTVTKRVGHVNTCMFPLALGCPPMTTSEGKEWVEPLITDPAQVKDFEAPPVRSGRTGLVLQCLEELVATLEPGECVRDVDTQSPLGVAELMWDDSFYFALLEQPDAVHELLDKVTDFIVEFVLEVQKVCGDRFNSCGFPALWDGPVGTMVADDTMSLVSPEMHLEFSVPYLNRMAERCGPLHYHSCTWWPHYFENIWQIGPVRSLNWNPGNSCDPAVIVKEFSGHAVMTPHIVLEMHRDTDVLKWNPNLADEAALFEHIVNAMDDKTTLYFWFSNVRDKGPVLERMVEIARQHGATPQQRGVA